MAYAMMTLAQLIAEVLPPETAIVAGHAAADREVTWAARPRPAPPAFGHLSGGEIVLLAVSRLNDVDDRMTLERVVRDLSTFGVTAIAVTGRISAAARAAADAGGIALLQLPAAADLGIVERAAAEAIGERRRAGQRRGQETGRRLMGLAIAGESLARLLDAIAAESRRAVALEDRDGALLALVGGDGLPGRDAIARLLSENQSMVSGWLAVAAIASPAEPPTTRAALDAGAGREPLERTLAPVIGREGLLGTLSLIARRGAAGLDDGLLASRGAAACSIVFGREHAGMAARREIELNVLDEVLDGALRNEVTLLQQASRLGHDLTASSRILVLRVDPPADRTPPAGPPPNICPLVAEALARRGLRLLWRSRGATAELVLGPAETMASTPSTPEAIADALHAELRRAATGLTVTAALGTPHPGLAGLQRSLQEATQALTIGVRRAGPGGLTRFADLGIYRLVFAAADLPELAALRDEALAALLAYDARHSANLVATLHAFLDANGGPKEAAAALGVHRNTVLYRLERIREVTGADLDDADTRLRLHLAVTVHQALPTTEVAP